MERHKAFALWAFGTQEPIELPTMLEEWNKRHGEQLRLNPDDKLCDTIPGMIKLFETEYEKKTDQETA